MKVGDLVRLRASAVLSGSYAIVASEIRHGINSSYVDVLLDGRIISIQLMRVLEVIGESR